MNQPAAAMLWPAVAYPLYQLNNRFANLSQICHIAGISHNLAQRRFFDSSKIIVSACI